MERRAGVYLPDSQRTDVVISLMHTDAAQSVGKLEVDVQAFGVDLLTVAGHNVTSGQRLKIDTPS